MTFCGLARHFAAPLAVGNRRPFKRVTDAKSEYSGRKIRRMENERLVLAFEPRPDTP